MTVNGILFNRLNMRKVRNCVCWHVERQTRVNRCRQFAKNVSINKHSDDCHGEPKFYLLWQYESRLNVNSSICPNIQTFQQTIKISEIFINYQVEYTKFCNKSYVDCFWDASDVLLNNYKKIVNKQYYALILTKKKNRMCPKNKNSKVSKYVIASS